MRAYTVNFVSRQEKGAYEIGTLSCVWFLSCPTTGFPPCITGNESSAALPNSARNRSVKRAAGMRMRPISSFFPTASQSHRVTTASTEAPWKSQRRDTQNRRGWGVNKRNRENAHLMDGREVRRRARRKKNEKSERLVVLTFRVYSWGGCAGEKFRVRYVRIRG